MLFYNNGQAPCFREIIGISRPDYRADGISSLFTTKDLALKCGEELVHSVGQVAKVCRGVKGRM